MAQRVDERTPTALNLDAYNKALKLSEFTFSVCKPKDKNVNNKHIPKRHMTIGNELKELAVEIGADILEANEIYVGSNISEEDRKINYKRRIELEEHARSCTYRMEHIMRILHFEHPFADSTITFWISLLCETRHLLTKWKDKEKATYKSLSEGTGCN